MRKAKVYKQDTQWITLIYYSNDPAGAIEYFNTWDAAMESANDWVMRGAPVDGIRSSRNQCK
jgi:hypothetical protein